MQKANIDPNISNMTPFNFYCKTCSEKRGTVFIRKEKIASGEEPTKEMSWINCEKCNGTLYFLLPL
jgi:hypothetical protein